MLSEAVKVIVRCRPMNSREKGLKCKVILRENACQKNCPVISRKNYKYNHTLHFSKWASHSISNLVLTSSICCSKYINLDWTELNFFWLKGSRARAFSSLWYLGSLLRTSLDLASSAHSNVSTVLPYNFV